jgi:hypothetical protein
LLRSLSRNYHLGTEGAAALAPALAANGALTSISLWGNNLGDKGWGAIFAAICGNKDSKIMSMDAHSENISPAGVKLIAEALRTSVTGALTSIDLSSNHLTNYGKNMMGIKELAAALGANGALTVTNLLGNQLDEESAKMLAEVAKQKGISLCGIRRDQTTANFRNKDLLPPDAILLASDLSQAIVTGGLTSINLSDNQLCGVWTDYSGQHGTYTSEGVTAIADAMRLNGALTECNLNYNPCICEDGEALIRKAIQRKAGFKLCIGDEYCAYAANHEN